jgi:hypothetical protein
MFCFSACSLAVTSRAQPSYKDEYSVLWIDRDKPRASIFLQCGKFPKSPSSLSSATIYHVSSVEEFKKALLGEVFKVKVSLFKSEKYEPRRFHAVVIMNWTTSQTKRIEFALSDIIQGYKSLKWDPPFYLLQGVAASFIRRDLQAYLVEHSPFASKGEEAEMTNAGSLETERFPAESPKRALSTFVNPFLQQYPDSNTKLSRTLSFD